jgi:DNA-binding NtrC family response regulator
MARILVIDDDAAILVTVELVLKRAGHDVVTAINAYDGLERLEQASFDLVVVDLFMPEMDGLEAITQICLRYPKLAIIVVSGHSFERTAAHRPDFLPLERSAFVSLSKPFRPAGLLEAVGKCLDTSLAPEAGKGASIEAAQALCHPARNGLSCRACRSP